MKYQWRLKKNSLAKAILNRQLENDSLANCYLIVGSDGIGKEKLVEDFLKMIRCQDKKEKPCNNCQECQAIENRSDTELLIVKPEPGKGVKIDQTREIKRRIRLKTFSQRQLVWIKKANRLTTEAANSILKILEDPSGKNRVIFILTASDLSLPLTIISRAQLIFLHPVDLPQENLSLVDRVIASSGLEDLFERIKKDKRQRKRVSTLFDQYRRLKKSPIADRIEMVNKKLVNWPIEELLFYLALFERRELSRKIGKESALTHQQNLERLMESYYLCRYQINRKILLKNLLLRIE